MNLASLRRLHVAGVLVALSLASSASAARPDIFRFQNQGVDPHLFDCGTFFINGQFDERGSVTTFFDQAGNPVRLNIHVMFDAQLTNETTGKTLRDAARDTVFVDVETGTETQVGVPIHWIIPGVGNIVLDAGKVIFDATTGEILFEAGRHPFLYLTGEERDALLCSALAGS